METGYIDSVVTSLVELRRMHSTAIGVCMHCGLDVATWSDVFHTGTGFVFCISGETRAEVSN